MCPYCNTSARVTKSNEIPFCWRVRSHLKSFFSSSNVEGISTSAHPSNAMIDVLYHQSKPLSKITNLVGHKSCSNVLSAVSLLSSNPVSSVSSPFPFRLDPQHVRVLLFRECDRRGRKLLYDSRTVIRLPVGDFHHSLSEHHSQCRGVLLSSTSKFSQTSPSSPKHCLSSSNFPSNQPCFTGTKSTSCGILPKHSSKKQDGINTGAPSFMEVRNGFGYQYQKELPDTKPIGEHVFGAVAMAYKGPSAKIHVMCEPSGVLISRTCGAPRCYKSPQTSCDNCLEGSFSSLSSSLNDLHMTKVESLESSLSKPSLKPSVPVEMYGIRGYRYQSEEDSGYSGPPSPFSSTCGSYLSPASLSSCTPSTGTPNSRNGSGNSLKNSGSSISSLQRRFLRNVSTSLDSFGFRSGAEEEHREEASGGPVDGKRLGIAVFIETKQGDAEVERQLRQWLFNFQDAVELSLNKLQSHVEAAYLRNSTFVSAVYQAVSQFQQELCDLVCAPRLQDPLWLRLYDTESENEKDFLYSRLGESLSFLLNKYDTKDTNFFISKLLTAVLTHHLGWVSTVAPQTPLRPNLDSKDQLHSSPNVVHDSGNCFSKSQPYNALWGQLYELTGSIGYPSRMTKTVIVGRECSILNQILIFLSYFIRCSKVEEKVFEESRESDNCDIFESSKSKRQSSFSSSSSMVKASPVSYKNATVITDTEVGCSCNDIPDRSLRISEEISVINDLNKAYSAEGEKSDHKCRLCGKKTVIKQSLQPNIQKVPNNSFSQCRRSSTAEGQLFANPNQGLNTSKTMNDLASLYLSDGVSPTESPVPFSPLYTNLKGIQNHNHGSVESTENMKLSLLSPEEHSCKAIKASIASGEKIDITFEKCEKVIFILGENERLEGLRPKKVEPDSSTEAFSTEDIKKLDKSTNDDLAHSLSANNSLDSFITALPPPVDNVRIETFRRQGKSATVLDGKSVITNKSINVYPSLEELKQELVKIPSISELKKKQVVISSDSLTRPTLIFGKNHRRVRSDPTTAVLCCGNPINVEDCDKTHSTCDEEIISKMDVDTGLIKHTEENDKGMLQTVKAPSVEIISQSSPQVAESLMGGILDHYSSIFVVHATTNADKLEDQLRIDLLASSQNPVLDSQTLESCAIVAEIDRWEIELVSSHSYAVERRTHDATSPITFGGIPIMISPLVSQITDSISHLVRIGSPPQFVANRVEHCLRDVYLKSQLLSRYLLEGTQLPLGHSSSLSHFGGQSLYNLSELTHNLGIDLNDLPLLLSVASTHTPALTRMFGLTFN